MQLYMRSQVIYSHSYKLFVDGVCFITCKQLNSQLLVTVCEEFTEGF